MTMIKWLLYIISTTTTVYYLVLMSIPFRLHLKVFFSVGNGQNYLVTKETIPLKNVSFYIPIPQKGEQRVLDIWEYTTFHYNTNTLCSPIYGIYIWLIFTLCPIYPFDGLLLTGKVAIFVLDRTSKANLPHLYWFCKPCFSVKYHLVMTNIAMV